MPNALLTQYFQKRGLFGDLNFAAINETHPDELFAAWLSLSDVRRNELDAEFQDIFELSCEKGFRAILDEAVWHLATDEDARTAFVEKLAGLSNHFERAMVTFSTTTNSGKGRSASITPTRCPIGASART